MSVLPVQSRRRSVLLLTELFPPAVGGSPVLFDSIYSRLPGTPVLVLADDAVGKDEQRPPLTVVRRPIRSRRWGFLDPQGLLQYARTARLTRSLGLRRDVVVHCGRALPEGVSAWLSRRLWGPPYVCWAHGEDIATALQSRELTLLMTRVFGDAGASLANSQNTGRMLKDLGVPSANIHVVYPGVDAQRFRPENDGAAIRARFAPNGETLLLSVGRLQRRKGHDLAIEAVGRLAPTTAIQYLIVGDGEERARLEQMAIEHGVGDRVHFAGEAAVDDLPRYYAACDVFLMPNRVHEGDVEGFGIVFLEAAATGRPAIGGTSGGVPEAVVHQETGVLVSGTDVSELASAIRDLAASPERRRTLGGAGRARVCGAFTWERAAAGVAAVHDAVAAREDGREP